MILLTTICDGLLQSEASVDAILALRILLPFYLLLLLRLQHQVECHLGFILVLYPYYSYLQASVLK
jgi:hypothetical protein